MLLNNKKCSNCESYYDPTLNQCPVCHKSNELYEQRHTPNSIVFLHPISQIGLFLAGFAYCGMLISQITATVLFRQIADEGLAKSLILFFAYLMMLGGLLTIVFTTRRQLFFEKFTRRIDYLFGLAYAGAIFVTGLLVGIIVNCFHQGTNDNQKAAIDLINNYPIFATFVICLIGPICEELTYRVGLYSFFRRINIYVAFIVTTLIFALIHFDFTSKDIIGELWSLPSYLICGFLLTLAYEHRGPACSMTAHIVYNTSAMFAIIIGNWLEKIYG